MKIKDKVLIVEDEQSISNFISMVLNANGYDTIIVGSGEEALTMIASHCPDLIVLDLGLPDMDGMEVLKSVRKWSNLPVVVVSARNHEHDKVEALDLGADDYITKPFNPLEVVARVKTQLRRYIRYNQTAPEPAPAAVYDCGGLYIDHESHTCTLYSKPLSLTPLEFEILWYLCSRKGHVVSSEELFEAVWGEKYLDSNNTVMAHIARLREKMGELPRKPKWIKTVWGVGYKIDE